MEGMKERTKGSLREIHDKVISNRELVDEIKAKVLENEKTILYNKQLIARGMSKQKQASNIDLNLLQDQRSNNSDDLAEIDDELKEIKSEMKHLQERVNTRPINIDRTMVDSTAEAADLANMEEKLSGFVEMHH